LVLVYWYISTLVISIKSTFVSI